MSPPLGTALHRKAELKGGGWAGVHSGEGNSGLT